MKKKVETPMCPGCLAKFQHNGMQMNCNACGLPDEVVDKGARAIRRWQRRHGQAERLGGSFGRRKRAHGRQRGAKKAQT